MGVPRAGWLKLSLRNDPHPYPSPQGGGGTRWGRSVLARVPTRWNHLVEKNSRKINCLSMIFSQKWFPLLRIML